MRPATLFGDKFDEYLGAPDPIPSEEARIKSKQKLKLEIDLERDRNELERINYQLDSDDVNWDLIDRKEYLDNRIKQFTKQLEVM